MDQDHVHTARAFDTTKSTITVTQETVTEQPKTTKSQGQSTGTKEL